MASIRATWIEMHLNTVLVFVVAARAVSLRAAVHLDSKHTHHRTHSYYVKYLDNLRSREYDCEYAAQ